MLILFHPISLRSSRKDIKEEAAVKVKKQEISISPSIQGNRLQELYKLIEGKLSQYSPCHKQRNFKKKEEFSPKVKKCKEWLWGKNKARKVKFWKAKTIVSKIFIKVFMRAGMASTQRSLSLIQFNLRFQQLSFLLSLHLLLQENVISRKIKKFLKQLRIFFKKDLGSPIVEPKTWKNLLLASSHKFRAMFLQATISMLGLPLWSSRKSTPLLPKEKRKSNRVVARSKNGKLN